MSKSGAINKRNGQEKKDFIIRSMQPSFPIAARAIYSDEIMIIDFIGDEIAPNKREAFASIVVTEEIAKDLHDKIGEFLSRLDWKSMC